MALPIGTRLGPYEIGPLLGAGGTGEVYRAADTRLNRTVAIKVLASPIADDPDRRERFNREAKAVSQLTHPHICALYDVGRDQDLDFLVMEYVDGETLAQRLMMGPLALELSLRYGTEVAGALDHAHRRGFVHRDLKPSNVMVTKSGVKLLDFGLATTVDVFAGVSSGASSPTRTLTAEGTIVGTLEYMAPEQLEGRRVDARCDIFALGALLHEMVTGRKAFSGTSRASVIAAILREEPPALRTIQPTSPPALDRAVTKCLAKDPDDRWQTARDLESELNWIQDTLRERAGATSTAPTQLKAWRWQWRTVIAVLVLVAVALFGLLVSRPQSAREIAPIQFTLNAPENAAFIESGAFMALSPDGRSLAFLAKTSDGRELVWVRPLDTVSARPLAGTDGARAPFWSPDSRAIGFFANNRLKRIDVSGANLQTLCEVVPPALGGTWNSDGIILFSGSVPPAGVILSRIAVGSGVPIAVTTLDRSREETGHTWPQFLPDGRHFLYRVRSRRADETGIYAGSLDTGVRTRLLQADANPIYAAPGYLLYGVEGSLFAQAFDASNLRLSGSPIALAQQVMYNDGTGRSALSVSDMGVLAYRQISNTQLTWFDRTGKQLGTVGERGHYLDPSLSPDGLSIAVSHVDAELGTSNIWLMDAAGRSATPLTAGRSWDRSPLWSLDGRFIVYASKRRGFELYRKPVEAGAGSEIPVLTGQSGFPFGWLRDDRSVIFGYEGSEQLGIVAIDGNRAPTKLQTAFTQRQVQVSADGQRLAYVSNETGTNEVYVRPAASMEPRTRVSVAGGVEPKWRRDGRELFYLAPDGHLMDVDVSGDSLAVGTPRPLFLTRATTTITFMAGRNQYDVSPDGQRFLMNIPVEGASAPITIVINWLEALRR